MKPLKGLRVIDFGQLTAGANSAAMLADLGADVVKIESGRYPDLFRILGQRDNEPGWWNRSTQFHFTNRNKRSVALDLKHPEGRRLIHALVAEADVVVENFRRGVMERLGLGYAAISQTNPKIILASITSQGETGPQRLYSSFGSTLDATGGLAALTGYAGDKPVISGMDVNYPDQVVSLFAAGVILVAVREARRTGRGAQLDIAQREVGTFLIGEQLLAASAALTHTEPHRTGNADPHYLLQDCFLGCDRRWLALTVADEADATKFMALTRRTSRELRQTVETWCGQRPAADAAQQLAAVGLAAAMVHDGMDMLRERALAGRTLVQDEKGDLVKGMPYSFGDRPLEVERTAPDLGQHTAEVLREVLGIDDDTIERLHALGVTRTEPFS